MGGKGNSKGSKGKSSNAYFRARGTETELRDFNSVLKACMGRSPEELRRLADWRSPDGQHFRLSKKLSFILRHADNVPLETNGFLAVDMILGYLSFLPLNHVGATALAVTVVAERPRDTAARLWTLLRQWSL